MDLLSKIPSPQSVRSGGADPLLRPMGSLSRMTRRGGSRIICLPTRADLDFHEVTPAERAVDREFEERSVFAAGFARLKRIDRSSFSWSGRSVPQVSPAFEAPVISESFVL
jgi:hypothetical protein